MKVCVFGAGAIGGYLGFCLARSGADVSLVARGSHFEAMRAGGLRLQYEGEEHVARLRCTDNPAELGEQDYLIIGLKAHTIDEAVDAMIPLLGPSTSIVTASNGIPYWYFHGDQRLSGVHFDSIDPGGRQWNRLGPERAVGCVVFPAAEMIAPGVIRHEHGRKFPIGEPDGQTTARVQRLREAMEAGGLEAPIREDIREQIWLKLCGNLCFNPISALTLATVDVIARDAGTRAICHAMMLEAKTIGECLGLQLRIDIERRIDGARALGPHKMSMLQDLERGRSMEIEPIVGVVQELGLHTGIPTPATDVVLALIRQRAKRAPESLH